MPGNKPTPDQWSPEAKLAVVIETGALNEAELSEYCRAKGLYVEQVKAWKADSLKGFASSREQELEARQQRKADRKQYVTWIREAKESGARLPLACEEAGISLRTYKRWYQNGKVLADKRPDAVRPEPSNKLSVAEQAIILNVSNEKRFASLPPTQIVPTLLEARQWVLKFTRWYNYEHKHSKLRFVTPHQRHTRQDKAILAKRKQNLEKKQRQPTQIAGVNAMFATANPSARQH